MAQPPFCWDEVSNQFIACDAESFTTERLSFCTAETAEACNDFDPYISGQYGDVDIEMPGACFDSEFECALGVGGSEGGGGFLPDLSAADGALIAGAILALWSSAFIFRLLRKQVEES